MNKEDIIESIILSPYFNVIENNATKQGMCFKRHIDDDCIVVQVEKLLVLEKSKITIGETFKFKYSINEREWKNGLDQLINRLVKIEKLEKEPHNASNT